MRPDAASWLVVATALMHILVPCDTQEPENISNNQNFKPAYHEQILKLGDSNDDELTKTLDKTTDDDSNRSFVSAIEIASQSDINGWTPVAAEAIERSDNMLTSPTEFLTVLGNNQSSILLHGLNNSTSSNEHLHQQVKSGEHIASTVLLINRNPSYNQSEGTDTATASSNVEPTSAPFDSKTVPGARSNDTSTQRPNEVSRSSGDPLEDSYVSNNVHKLSEFGTKLETEKIQSEIGDLELQSGAKRKRKKKKKKKPRINSIRGEMEVHHQQPEVKLISYSAIDRERLNSAIGGTTIEPSGLMRWSTGFSDISGRSPIGLPVGPSNTSLKITSAPSYLSTGQSMKLFASMASSPSPLVSGLHDLRLRANQLRQRQRANLVSHHLKSPNPAQQESFMFDASDLPTRLAHMFPGVLSEPIGGGFITTKGDSPTTGAQEISLERSPTHNADTELRKPLTHDEQLLRTLDSMSSLSNVNRPAHQEEFLASSSSQASNEYETALKHQQRDPIVHGSENADSSGPSMDSISNGQEWSNAPLSDSGEYLEPTSTGNINNDSESGDTRETIQAQHGQSSESNEPKENSPVEDNRQSSSHIRAGAERELLVGPFKSEAEAPPTITLSGVVYQKSGVSSPFVRGTLTTSTKDIRPTQEHLRDSDIGNSPSSSKNTKTTAKQIDSSAETSKHWLPYAVNQKQLVSASGADFRQLLNTKMEGQTKETNMNPHYPIESSIHGLQTDATAPMNLRLANTMATSPLSSILLLSSLANGALHLDEELLSLIEPPKSLLSSSASVTSPLVVQGPPKSAPKASLLAAPREQAPVWASKKGEQYYLGAHLSASEPSPVTAASGKHKDKSGPIVIVQKDVKPIKYHMLRAYLKLRRLLRPFEATYVFPNEQAGLVKKRQDPQHDPR